jgi:hypothetical protein
MDEMRPCPHYGATTAPSLEQNHTALFKLAHYPLITKLYKIALKREISNCLEGFRGRPTMAKHKPAQDEKGRFLTGNSGGGRPKGSRNQLGEAFVADLYADWQANGADTIARVREERPQDYLKVLASILPKDVNLNVSRFDHMTEAELDAEITRLDLAPEKRPPRLIV